MLMALLKTNHKKLLRFCRFLYHLVYSNLLC